MFVCQVFVHLENWIVWNGPKAWTRFFFSRSNAKSDQNPPLSRCVIYLSIDLFIYLFILLMFVFVLRFVQHYCFFLSPGQSETVLRYWFKFVSFCVIITLLIERCWSFFFWRVLFWFYLQYLFFLYSFFGEFYLGTYMKWKSTVRQIASLDRQLFRYQVQTKQPTSSFTTTTHTHSHIHTCISESREKNQEYE